MKSQVKAMKKEMDWYKAPQRIRKVAMELARKGFEPDGHGQGMGCEDWSFFLKIGRDELSVSIGTCTGDAYVTFSNSTLTEDVFNCYGLTNRRAAMMAMRLIENKRLRQRMAAIVKEGSNAFEEHRLPSEHDLLACERPI